MKKLLCIVCLLATILFVNAANAAVGSPARNGQRASVSVSTVRVAAKCTTCGQASRPVVVRPVRTACTSCGRRVVRPVVRVSACTTCGHRGFHGRHFGHRHFHGRHFGHRHFHGRRFACSRCGR